MTIEERGESFATKRGHGERIYNEDKYTGYIAGAAEQQEIDIQRAVEFLKNEVDVKDHPRYTKEWYIEELIKAMKGE